MTPHHVRTAYAAIRHIDGWFSHPAALLIGLVDELQRRRGVVDGGALEIGVHHGRSALFIARLLDRPRETLVVCDVFDAAANVSRSGLGDRDRFMRHAGEAFTDLSFLRVHAQPSASLTAAALGRGYRLVHIDGGHTAPECLADLHLAASVLGPEGAIALDDPFRPDWPGVTEAVFEFLRDRRHDIVPVAVGFNKLVLMRAAAVPAYGEQLRAEGLAGRYFPPPWTMRHVELLGHPYLVIGSPVSNDEWSARMLQIGWRLHRRLQRPAPLV